MTNDNSNGEVYGSKVLTLAIIAVSAFILAGTIYSPSQQAPNAAQPAAQQIVDTTHTVSNGVSG